MNGASKPSAGASSGGTRKEQKQAAAQSRQRLAQLCKPIEKLLGRLEKDMAALAQEKTGLEDFLASTEAYSEDNRSRLAADIKRQGEIVTQLAEMEEQWLQAQEDLEAVQNQAEGD
jgi:ATP-binding cassette subfamily F protein 3